MAATLLSPKLIILRRTRHPTGFLRWKQSLFFLFRQRRPYRGCTSALHRANTISLQSHEDGRQASKASYWSKTKTLEKSPVQPPKNWETPMPPNIAKLRPPMCIKKTIWMGAWWQFRNSIISKKNLTDTPGYPSSNDPPICLPVKCLPMSVPMWWLSI